MKKTIVITGINGFLGSRLKDILNNDFQLYGIERKEDFNGPIKTFASTNLDEIDINPDFVIMCHAAVSSGQINVETDLLYQVNVKLTNEILAKFNNSKIIYISSASIYNLNETIITENTVNSPNNEYAISKYWAEKLVLNTNRAVIVRLSSLYGVKMKENTIIPNYINQALNNGNIEVWGEGKREQNYIFIDDVCSLIKNVFEKFNKVCNKTLLAVSNREYTNLELAKIIAKETNAKIKLVNQDYSASLNYNNLETRTVLNWKAESNFKQEIIKYIKWKQKQS
ncbi:hypothetical protein GCM10022291_12330 [Postechiella marina]|uniref:NAD-dependent epimerase/dehydratase domain-containing protein n=1 Tax=Postechiella marina TaxID=943941 RepID=A0ABP8C5B5_9FLAO